MAKTKFSPRPPFIDVLLSILVVELLLVGIAKTGLTSYAFTSSQKANAVMALGPITESTLNSKVIPLEEVPVSKNKSLYVKIVDSCDFAYVGGCVAARSGPGKSHERLLDLRNGMILPVVEEIKNDEGTWYKIAFDEWLRYPERVKGNWYVSAEFGEILFEEKENILSSTTTLSEKKKIIVDRTKQKLFAYDEDVLVMEANISSGKELTPTPRGEFKIFRKTPSRYMQGPLPYLADKQIYDLPGVPWTLYFTDGGAAIHGTYWHKNFGTQHSHGCVNLTPADAKILYRWAELGTKVVVKD